MTVSEKSRLTIELPSDTEIVMRRTFDSPRELVFDAFTKREHLVHWWGPKGSTLSVCEMDARPGGKWRMVIREADGSDNGFGGEVREVRRPERFVWTFGWDGAPGQDGPEEMTFEERDGKTTVTTRSLFPSKEVRDMIIQHGMEEGAAQSLDRLAEHLAKVRAA
ncbi:MAG TPA: SRPBCC family protein [Chloroflexota bacterium]|nr:SRPBCC family protein [Chloroflexota bacterium]